MAISNQDQALYEMSQILQGDREARLDFEFSATMLTFGIWGPRLPTFWQYSPRSEMLCIQVFGEENLLKNLKLAMLKEVVGLGPQRYCIFFNRAPHFYSKLKLIMSSLPQEKMFLYPATARLEGPFLQEPWLSRGRAISSRPSLTFDEYLANFVNQ